MKVKFGLKNVNTFPLTETTDPDTGVVSMSYGTKVAIPGAVNLNLDVAGDDPEPFYADDGIYYQAPGTAGGYTGTLEIALIPDAIKTAYMNYAVDDDDIMIEIAKTATKYFGMTFEIDGDTKARKFVMYKCSLSRSALAASTKTNSVEPQTDTLNLTALPTAALFSLEVDGTDIDTAVVHGYTTEDADATVYANWHTTPHLPNHS